MATRGAHTDSSERLSMTGTVLPSRDRAQSLAYASPCAFSNVLCSVVQLNLCVTILILLNSTIY